MGHNKRDNSSHLLKHARECQHTVVWNVNYKGSVKRQISEALYIRTLNPTLNIKEKSIRLELHS